jgi:hypothetical protein
MLNLDLAVEPLSLLCFIQLLRHGPLRVAPFPLFDGEDIVVGPELGLQSAIARVARVNRVRDAKGNPLQLATGFSVDRELQRLSKVASSVPDVSESH